MAAAARTFRVATVQLGPITVPMGIQGAVEDEDAGLISLCTHDGDPVHEGTAPSRIKRVDYCPECDNKDRDTFRKGRAAGGAVVMLDTTAVQELAATEEQKKTIPLTVHPAAELSGLFPTGKSYYLAPRKGFEDGYALLSTLVGRHAEKGFIGEFSFGGAPALFQVFTLEGVLTMRQLARPELVRARPQVGGTLNEQYLAMAEHAADILCTPYDEANYRDRRAAALAKLVESATPVSLADKTATVGDLGAALLEFVAKHEAATPAVEEPPAPRRRPAAKKAAPGAPRRRTAKEQTPDRQNPPLAS
jgi:non-homologous end joining protein Ku